MNASAPILEARDLAVTPPGARAPAVRGVSLAVTRGEWVAVVGPNGGGKTSLLLALAGLWPASGGAVTFAGAPLSAGGRDPRIAAVLQDPSSQILAATVGDEMAFTARNLGVAESRIADAVRAWGERFALGRDLDRDPRTLSAGRQQLVLLAAALIAEPALLIADEPAAHLDPVARAIVLDAIAERAARGLAVVWATQDPGETRAASRSIEVGEIAPPAERPVARATPGREAAVRILISDHAPESGPRVSVAEPMEIVIERPGVTALVGPNGAGKSVVLAAAAGIEPCSQIKVEWKRDPEPPPIVALQYPELQVFEELVADELAFAPVSRGIGRGPALEAAKQCLEALGWDAEAMLARHTWSLSTGEKRLIEVVGALAAPSSLILLDEPTAGIDPARRSALAGLVRKRASEVPVLVASQDRAWLTDLGVREFALGDVSAKSQAKKRLTQHCQGP
ncbi:MAG: ABC transporter ATP-binding protein [Candidatus Eisenbacteria bacterium]|uniref:ABC transporter ATP-binding protein n=1 Tax=Eiseniibacteriota bacterium TaxID=2212470 RepID=A0A9D6L8S9_UNCEI|nr:ABC transporter ATP-binding protein [Candidatus Eisenbacteria bacterium]MBI3539974.1 ABC transporter ATP-binding protein [Candidatus Eisenbacteria bacterium]